MTHKNKLVIAIATAVLAVLSVTVACAQDKYSLKTPSGIAFSDFKGYEDWAVVSSARTDEVLKVIVANPIMIKAYKAGVPGNGQPFPEGSKIAKLQWSFKKSTEAPFVVDVPDVPTQAFLMEKDSKRFPKSGGWGYALFNYEVATGKLTADPAPSDCGHACHVAVKAKDLHLPPVPEALNVAYRLTCSCIGSVRMTRERARPWMHPSSQWAPMRPKSRSRSIASRWACSSRSVATSSCSTPPGTRRWHAR